MYAISFYWIHILFNFQNYGTFSLEILLLPIVFSSQPQSYFPSCILFLQCDIPPIDRWDLCCLLLKLVGLVAAKCCCMTSAARPQKVIKLPVSSLGTITPGTQFPCMRKTNQPHWVVIFTSSYVGMRSQLIAAKSTTGVSEQTFRWVQLSVSESSLVLESSHLRPQTS